MSVLRLTTPTGSIALRDAGEAVCSSCARHVDTTATIVVALGERTLDVPHVCGGCLAEGLAIVFGRNHLEAGGRIGDLEVPAPDDAGACPHCRRLDGVEREAGDPERRHCAHCGAVWRGRRDPWPADEDV